MEEIIKITKEQQRFQCLGNQTLQPVTRVLWFSLEAGAAKMNLVRARIRVGGMKFEDAEGGEVGVGTEAEGWSSS